MSNSELQLGQMRIPDILETIADLSNDEVFTPPDLANKVLDMLPTEIWSNSKITFLDPACKTGVFLREITKRLIVGLKDEIPDLQDRVNHILTKQVYGLGVTELTALMSRRTLYCSTKANSDVSVCTAFDNAEGNIKFPNSKHTFNKKTNKCEICGAGKDLYDDVKGLDNYAYSFLHDNLKEVFGDVKFDVIIGNPPYQLSDGLKGGNSGRAKAIYNLFVDKALDLNPNYLSMIMPSRWMTNTAEGISEEWTKKMITSNKIIKMVDYENGDSLFGSVGIAGGINYFLWAKSHNDKCKYTYIPHKGGKPISKTMYLDNFDLGFVVRNIKAYSVVEKIEKKEKFYYKKNNFESIVGTKHFYDKDEELTSSWRGYRPKKDDLHTVKYYVSEKTNEIPFAYVKPSDIKKNYNFKNVNKVIIPTSQSSMSLILGVPRFSEKNSVSSQTYLVIGHELNLTKEECLNIMKYISTKFFRYLVRIKKVTQNGPRGVYQLVPLQDWKEEWTDEKLYKKYNLTQEEIDDIEETIAELNISKEIQIANDLD